MEENYICSFCGANSSQVKQMIRGGANVFICDSCVEQCVEVISENSGNKKAIKSPSSSKFIHTPEKIVKHLDDYVIGQDQAKRILAVAVYNHYKRINSKTNVEIQKSNILLLGPSGVGKSLLVSTLAKLLDVPYSVSDATTLTEAGYVGDDVDQIIGRLVVAANGDITRAERGICYVDEIDKVRQSDGNGRDVRGEGVQQALLKMLEGTVVQVNPKGEKKQPQAPLVDVNTKNILFIVSGAFSRLTDTNIQRRPLGFGKQDKTEKDSPPVTAKDLIKFGLIPEFVGRIPVIGKLHSLNRDSLLRILTEPKNNLIDQYKALFQMDGVNIKFEKDFLEHVADKAIKEGTGARSLKTIMEESLMDLMFNAPNKKFKEFTVTKEIFEQKREKTAQIEIV